MAKVFTLMELLDNGVKLAKREHEKLDLINQLADFCSNSGMHFENDEYFDLENKIVAAIDYGNSHKYKFVDFENYYSEAVQSFLRLKNWYIKKYKDRVNISYAICSYGNEEKLIECLKYIFTYPRADLEVVVLDCSLNSNIEDKLESLRPNKIKYFKSSGRNKVENEMEVLSKCEGAFVFPLYEEDLFVEASVALIIDMIYDNPQAGVIFCPQPNSMALTANMWEALSPGDVRLKKATNIKYKTGFGYSRHAFNIENYNSDDIKSFDSPEGLYTDIAYKISEEYESLILCIPIYALEP